MRWGAGLDYRIEKVVIEMIFEGEEGIIHMAIWRRRVLGRETI